MILYPPARGIDYAFGRPTAESILRNGYTFVVRYISVPPASSSKNLTASERDMLLAAGIGILLVWEMSAATPGKGALQGEIDGANARRKATDLGYPTSVPILVAVDTDTTATTIAAHEGYVRAFAEACDPYPIGVYGDADILLRVGKLSQIGWLPNASYWSQTRRAEAMAAGLIHVLQRRGYSMDGVAVDPNDVIQPIRAWSRLATVPIEKPPPVVVLPPTPPEESDMPAIGVNKEWYGGDGGDAGKVHFEFLRDHAGKMRYLVLADHEWRAFGAPAGVATSNDDLLAMGAWQPAPAVAATGKLTVVSTVSSG